jgi:hypothetical protein
VPQPIYVCSNNFYCTRDARGEVTGAGIATLQTTPDAAPGNVFLVAPRGTVDAGDAAKQPARNVGDLPSIITVEVIGYGCGDGMQHEDLQNERRKKTGQANQCGAGL